MLSVVKEWFYYKQSTGERKKILQRYRVRKNCFWVFDFFFNVKKEAGSCWTRGNEKVETRRFGHGSAMKFFSYLCTMLYQRFFSTT
jgi:hypothetical protein